ncbi:MAG: tetraacyldisaccharide 4'-kinase [Pseudomonadota bacterium]
MKTKLVSFVERAWFSSPGVLWFLLPLEWLYGVTVRWRRFLYRKGYFESTHPGIPVVVVGNLTAGGSGKTPVVKSIAQLLIDQGHRVAIISRGYGGTEVGPHHVHRDDTAARVGDEALMLARSVACDVIIGRNRVAAAVLAQRQGAQVVVSDDGLQHYALRRDIEIIAIDRDGGFGNGHLIPLGPLREPVKRLNDADFVLERGGDVSSSKLVYRPYSFLNRQSGVCTAIEDFVSVQLTEGQNSRSNPSRDQQRIGGDSKETDTDNEDDSGIAVHAIAAIARPRRFFDELRTLGLQPVEHSYPDHSTPAAGDLAKLYDLPLVMTEKDHVKLASDIHPNSWVLLMQTVFPEDFEQQLLGRLGALGAPLAAEPSSPTGEAPASLENSNGGMHP